MSWSSIPAPQGNGHFQGCLSGESNRAPVLAMAQIPAVPMNVHKHDIAAIDSFQLLNCHTGPLHSEQQETADTVQSANKVSMSDGIQQPKRY